METTNNIANTKWYDNKCTHVISIYIGPLPLNNVIRWYVADKNKVDVPRPASVTEYNLFRGEINNLHDLLVELYRVNIKEDFTFVFLSFVGHECCQFMDFENRRHCKQLKIKHTIS